MTYLFTARPLTLFSNTDVMPNCMNLATFDGGPNAIPEFD